jgi:hypothetical protein
LLESGLHGKIFIFAFGFIAGKRDVGIAITMMKDASDTFYRRIYQAQY